MPTITRSELTAAEAVVNSWKLLGIEAVYTGDVITRFAKKSKHIVLRAGLIFQAGREMVKLTSMKGTCLACYIVIYHRGSPHGWCISPEMPEITTFYQNVTW
jgi:hypothetical protein